MHLRVSAVVLAVLCAAQAAPAPRDYESQKPKTQYGIVKLTAETTVLRMRVFLLAIDVNFSVKNYNRQIFEAMAVIGVPEANVTSLKVELTQRTESVNAALLEVMNQAQQLIDHANEVNHHVAYNPGRLQADLATLSGLVDKVGMAFSSADSSISLTVQFMKFKMETLVNGRPGADSVYQLIDEAVALLRDHRAKCDLEKVALEETARDTQQRLQALVDLV